MRVLCEKGRSQIENSDVVRTSTSNTGFAMSASVVYKSTAQRSPNLIDSFHFFYHFCAFFIWSAGNTIFSSCP